MVLLDTSVWIEYFRPRPQINPAIVALLLEERRVVTCLPVRAELYSGVYFPEARRKFVWAFDASRTIDPDWNAVGTWDQLASFAQVAHRRGLGLPGLVDRMILLAARESDGYLWTLERKLQRLAEAVGVPVFSPEAS